MPGGAFQKQSDGCAHKRRRRERVEAWFRRLPPGETSQRLIQPETAQPAQSLASRKIRRVLIRAPPAWRMLAGTRRRLRAPERFRAVVCNTTGSGRSKMPGGESIQRAPVLEQY